jgi:hypothetical protein
MRSVGICYGAMDWQWYIGGFVGNIDGDVDGRGLCTKKWQGHLEAKSFVGLRYSR